MKIVKFDEKIDSVDTLMGVSDKLVDYLERFEEDNAAEVVRNLQNKIGRTGMDDKVLKEYQIHTDQLKSIANSLKKIQEDLIDEQDTSIKKIDKPKKVSFIGKAKNVVEKVKDKVAEKTSWLDKIKNWLFKGGFMNLLKRFLPAALATLLGWLSPKKLISALGKLLWKGVKGTGKAIAKGIAKGAKWAGSKIASGAKKLGGKAATKVKDAWKWGKDLVKGNKNAGKKAKGVVDQSLRNLRKNSTSAWGNISNFFSKATSSIKNSKLVKGATNLATKTGSAIAKGAKAVKNAVTSMPDKIVKLFEKLKNKVTSIGPKIAKALSKKGGKTAVNLGTKILGALSKVGAKLIPGLGWALIAYDVYSAYKKSSSVTSFVVNLIDNLSGGLIGMAGAAAIEGFDGENLGEYVDSLIQGMLNPEEVGDIDIDGLDDTVLKIIEKVEKMDGSEIKALQESLKGNKHKDKIIKKYTELSNQVKSGKKTKEQAKKEFDDFVVNTMGSGSKGVKGADGANGTNGVNGSNGANGINGTNGTEIVIRNPEELVDLNQAVIDNAAIASAAVASTVANNISEQAIGAMVTINQSTANINSNQGQVDPTYVM